MVSGRFQRRLQKIRDAPRSVSRNDLVWVLTYLGFEEAGGKGSHQSYQYPNRQGFFLTLPDQNPLHVGYVKDALGLIEELLENGEE